MDQNQNNRSNNTCFEYQVNGFHVMGQQNCSLCKQLNFQLQQYSVPQESLEIQNLNQQVNNDHTNQLQQQQQLENEFKKYEDQDDQGEEVFEEEEDDDQDSDQFQDSDQQKEIDDKLIQKYLVLYKSCSCCKGYVYGCTGEICKHLKQCYCLKKDQEEQIYDI